MSSEFISTGVQSAPHNSPSQGYISLRKIVSEVLLTQVTTLKDWGVEVGQHSFLIAIALGAEPKGIVPLPGLIYSKVRGSTIATQSSNPDIYNLSLLGA